MRRTAIPFVLIFLMISTAVSYGFPAAASASNEAPAVNTVSASGAASTQNLPSAENTPAGWAAEEVSLAQVAGLDIGDMQYKSNITRLEFARLIYRMMGVKADENRSEEAPEEESRIDENPADESRIDEQPADESFADPGSSNEKMTDELSGEVNPACEKTVVEDNNEISDDDLYCAEENTTGSGNISSQGVGYASPFIDTTDEAVIALYYMGIVNGMTANSFEPEKNLSREQGAAILVRVSKYFGFENPNGTPARFYDGGQMGAWAFQDIKYISGHRTPDGRSIMGGYNDRFNPKGTYTVQEAILSVYRLYTSLSMKASTDTSWKTKTGCLFSQVVLSAAGDCTLGRDLSADYSTSLDAEYDRSGGDTSIFFKNVSQFFNDDITIVNFEGTLTDSPAAASKTFRFKGRKEYTNILKKGSIDVVNIANNHSHDYLDRGFYDTVNALTVAGIGYCGYNYTYVKTVNGIKYGFYGLAPMSSGLSSDIRTSISNNIAALKSKGAQYIVGSFHWGIERAYSPTSNQKSIAHYAADCGTDLVLGHHPHVLQNIERYNGTEIVYSLGNFCFGGNRNPSDKNTVVFQEKVIFDLETGAIVSRERTYTPYRLSSVTYKNDYRPVPVYGEEAAAVKKKLWVA